MKIFDAEPLTARKMMLETVTVFQKCRLWCYACKIGKGSLANDSTGPFVLRCLED